LGLVNIIDKRVKQRHFRNVCSMLQRDVARVYSDSLQVHTNAHESRKERQERDKLCMYVTLKKTVCARACGVLCCVACVHCGHWEMARQGESAGAGI
jgi:hypothetical protein